MTTPALRFQGVEKRFPRFHLGPLDLMVPTGAIYGLVGPNGAGKTTSLDLVMGIGRADAGAIHAFGLDARADEVAVKRRIGYVSPDASFVLWKKVHRLLHFVRQFYPDWDEEYCRYLLQRLGIEYRDDIKTLSFGTRVKLGLVLALAHKPDLLLLDEPTLGIDPVAKQQIFRELLAAVQEEQRTVLISSHGLADLERVADHIGLIHKGRLLLQGATADLLERFRMADVVYPGAALPDGLEGVWVRGHSDDRWRLLLDTSSSGANTLKAQGAQELVLAPVSLEELFVTLVQED